jgi:hypothetical protein
MVKSKSIAKIVGPTLIVMVFSEMRFWNPTLYDTQIVPLIYLNGMILFVSGLAIISNHNVWVYGWQTIVTIICMYANWFTKNAFPRNTKNSIQK